MIIAIDGPAGAGKSSTARALAAALGFRYLDSGAMYRAVALSWLEDPSRGAAEHAATLEIELGERVRLGGRDVTDAIRAARVSELASEVAADPAVRAALVARQRALIADGDWVAEGRDIGTVVAPGAEVKVFLDADPRVRARRRAAELGADADAVLAQQRERDGRDSGREHSPLEPAPDAVVLDTSGLTLAEAVDRIARLARAVGRTTP